MSKKQGFALPLVLFTLLGISLIATLSVKLSLIDENLGRTETDRNISKQMAEMGIIDAIDDITCESRVDGTSNLSDDRYFSKNTPFAVADGVCFKGICGKTDIDTPIWQNLETANKSDLNFADYGEFTGKNNFGNDIRLGTIKNPRYMIETIQTAAISGTDIEEYVYRITAVGYGRFSSRSFTKLQVVYRPKNQLCGYNADYTRTSVI